MQQAGFKNWNDEFLERLLTRVLPDGLFVIVHRPSGKLVATAMAVHSPCKLHPFGGELGWVAGDPAHSGKGLGLAVCSAVTRRFIEAGYRRIYLRTDDWRLPALKTYMKLGYVPFIYAPDMVERWKKVYDKLGIQCSTDNWVWVPAEYFQKKSASDQLRSWRQTTHLPENALIFKEEFDSFLPDRVLDFHTHIMPEGVLPSGESYSCAGYPIQKYDYNDLANDMSELYPSRQIFAVCFGFPKPEYNRELNNDYVGRCADRKRFFPFRLLDPVNDTPEKLRTDIVNYKFLGLKPYLDYVHKADKNTVEIHDMLPASLMEVANEFGLIITLHIPRANRLADPLNRKQLRELCCKYPRVKIVLAHVGRAYFLKNIIRNLDELSDLPNLWYDLAMLNNWEVLEYLFAHVPSDKILYATDMPIAVAPGKSVEINDQYTYITPVPWSLSICDTQKKIKFTSFVYEELRAIKKAVERMGLDKKFVKAIFYDNGASLLSLIHLF
jgi:mycothiol synthase